MNHIEEARQRIAAMMSDDDAAEALAKVTMTATGASTVSPTTPEVAVKFALQSTAKKPAISLTFGLKQAYLDDPAAFVAKYSEDFKFWTRINLQFELLSQTVLQTLERDNAFYNISSMVNKKTDNSDTVRLGTAINFDILPITNREGDVFVKGFGLHVFGKRFLRFVGSLAEPMGLATLQADGVSYVFTTDFYEELNNGVTVLKQSLFEKVKEGEAISEEEKLNHPDAVTLFIAQKQLQNLNDMLMQREVDFRTFGGVIGRESVPEDKNKQRNFVKDVAHSGTEEGKKLLEVAVA